MQVALKREMRRRGCSTDEFGLLALQSFGESIIQSEQRRHRSWLHRLVIPLEQYPRLMAYVAILLPTFIAVYEHHSHAIILADNQSTQQKKHDDELKEAKDRIQISDAQIAKLAEQIAVNQRGPVKRANFR